MSGYRRVNYYELCRLCTSNKGTKVHMFKEEGKRRQIPTKIQICLRLQVNEQDSLPKLICNMCLEKLENYFDFRTNCVNAEAMLESYAKNLSLNNDFVMDGKVYIKENKLDSIEEGNSNKEDILNNTIAQGGNIQMKESEIKISSQQNEIVTLPVSLNNLGRLVQAATIHILPEKELVKLQTNFKNTIQVQQNAERITGEHSYSYGIQGRTVEDSADQSTEQNENKNVMNSCTQMDKNDFVTHSADIGTDDSQDKTSNSITQIGEFLKLKNESINEESEKFRCDNCGLIFTSLLEKTSHSESCSTIDDSLKISEPVVMVDVEEDKTVVNCGPFNCEDCGKVFKRKEHLHQHRRLHTGERPFRCSQCPSAFSRKEHLARHILCHTGEKHYSCGVCGKLFGRKDNVGKHMRTHQIKTTFVAADGNKVKTTCESEGTSTLGHKCVLCGKDFPTEECLKMHLSLNHTESDKCGIVMVLNAEQPVSLLEKALKQIPG
uniref:Putative c2h2-type zn-finger protein n=1 Tax=Triatoma infestans TaxID=30076 RepID=A0A023EY60_TRIIF